MREPTVGLIGLGEIGRGFALDLADQGFRVIGFDLDPALVTDPFEPAASCREVAERADVLLVAVPGSAPFARVMDEVLPVLHPAHVVVDAGTTQPSVDIHYAAMVDAKGAALVDAPLTLRQGGRTFLVGGSLPATGRTVLEALGRVVAVGEVGAGQRTKLVNQLLVVGNVAVQAEAVELARRAGVDIGVLTDTLHWPISEALLAEVFEDSNQITLIRKDCSYVLDLAAEYGARSPVAALLAEIFNDAEPGPMHAVVKYWRSPETT